VTALVRLLRTTAFKLSVAYLLVFVLFAGAILGYVAFNARRLLDAQTVETLNSEVNALSEQYRNGGIRRLINVVDRRSRRPGSFLYSVQSPSGELVAGNIAALPQSVLAVPGTRETPYARSDEGDQPQRLALARVYHLPANYRLIVGRDLEERARLYSVINRALRISLLLIVFLGVAAALFVARRVLKRVDAMTETSRSIMAGNLAGRLPVTGTNDELDRLAQSLNTMLERIGELMQGMREVSDNIAHDLKTPLTRLRNSAEAALRNAATPAEYRAALERTIDESDGLIRTFDALLMIARAEAGNSTEGFADCDVGAVVRDVAELYEPLAEEARADLNVLTAEGLRVRANRELIGQAVANLIDNALKYGLAGEGSGERGSIGLEARRVGGDLVIAVSDRGQGIGESHRDKAIERFGRLDEAAGKPGSGLGLSLAAAIARLHGGQLRLEDNKPGLRAVIAIPAGA
jgi:signal transduction histidine kinase